LFGGDVAVNLIPVGMGAGQSRMNLRQRKALDPGGDLLGSQSQIVAPGDAPDRERVKNILGTRL
jgi:hypothetical protein